MSFNSLNLLMNLTTPLNATTEHFTFARALIDTPMSAWQRPLTSLWSLQMTQHLWNWFNKVMRHLQGGGNCPWNVVQKQPSIPECFQDNGGLSRLQVEGSLRDTKEPSDRWYDNCTSDDFKDLERVVQTAQHTAMGKAMRILKDLSHLHNSLLSLMPSAIWYRIQTPHTSRLRNVIFFSPYGL